MFGYIEEAGLTACTVEQPGYGATCADQRRRPLTSHACDDSIKSCAGFAFVALDLSRTGVSGERAFWREGGGGGEAVALESATCCRAVSADMSMIGSVVNVRRDAVRSP